MRFNLVLAILLGLALWSCSQPAAQSEHASKEKLTIEHIIKNISMDKTFTEYDRFRDETHNFSAAANVAGQLFLGFSYFCHGNATECDPGFVFANFWTISPSPYADSHEVIFLADDLRIHAVFGERGEQWNSLGDGNETVLAGFKPDDFLKLIRAHSLEGRLGPTEFRVQESDLEKWRTFATGIRSSKK